MSRVPHFYFAVSRPDGSWTDLSDYLAFAQVDLGSITHYGETTGVDRAIREAEFELAHDRQMIPVWDSEISRDSEDVVGDSEDVIGDEDDDAALLINLLFGVDYQWVGNSFHPLDQRSDWNQFNGQYAPLLFPRRECFFAVAFTDAGEVPDESDFKPLFQGVLGDGIQNIGSGSVRLQVRDLAKYLTDYQITTRKTYGSAEGTPLENVLKAILTDNGFSDFANELWVPQSPGWMVREHEVGHMSVWDALQAEVKPTGWYLGFLYNPSAGKFALTLLEPPRTKNTPDFVLTIKDDIVVQTLDVSDADIRNQVTVTWIDPTSGDRKTVVKEDSASQTVFGVRPMLVEEDDTSLIDTQQEAEDFAERMLWDLKDLRATTRVESRAIPELDIFSGVLVDDPRIFSSPQFFGVETIRHEFDLRTEQQKYRTHFIGSGHVIGGRSKWLEMEARPGVKPPLRPEDMVGGGRVMPKPANVSARGIIRGVAIDVPAPPVNANRWKVTEVHLSTTQGFTPSESTLVAAGRETHFEITDDGTAPLVSGTKYYMKTRYVDMVGRAGSYSDEVSAVAGKVTLGDILSVDADTIIQGILDADVVRIVGGGGAIVLDQDGLRAFKGANVTVQINTSGDAFFQGSVRAGELILPVEPI